MFCADFSLVKHSYPEITVVPLRCRCWTCEDCRPGRKARLAAEARAGSPTVFITLTTRRRSRGDPDQAARDLVAAWRTVRLEYLKQHGKRSLDFLAVFEATKLGWPHLHIVARAKWVDQRWLSRRMKALIGAPIVDVRRIKNQRQIAAYVTKYIGKNPHRFAGVKRYWRSLKYLTPETDEDNKNELQIPIWSMDPRSWQRIVHEYEDVGWQAEYKRGGAVLRPRPREPGSEVRWPCVF